MEPARVEEAVVDVPLVTAVATATPEDAPTTEAEVVAVSATTLVPAEGSAPEEGKKRGRKSGTSVPRWTPAEEETLKALVEELGEKSWPTVAARLETGRTPAGVEQHWQIMSGKRQRNGKKSSKEGEGEAGEAGPGASSEEKKAAKAALQAEKAASRASKTAAKEEKAAERAAKAEEQATKKAEKEEEKRARTAAVEKRKAEREAIASLPKKPVSAYLHYCAEMRAQVKADDPTIISNDVVKLLGEKWNALTDKSKWEEAAKADGDRFAQECAERGLDPEEVKEKLKKQKTGAKKGEEGGEEGETTPKEKKSKKKAAGSAGDEGDEPELLPWAVPAGFAVSPRPDPDSLAPNSEASKQLVGRSILYHWANVGWCIGVIKKCNADKRKTVDGDMVNFYVYYELDDDLSRHVLELPSYIPDGPENSWVLLEAGGGAPASQADLVMAEVVVTETDDMEAAPAEVELAAPGTVAVAPTIEDAD